MKSPKPGGTLYPIAAVHISLAPSLNLAAIRLEYFKNAGQKLFISEAYSADAGSLEELGKRLLEAAAQLRAGTAATTGLAAH